MQYYKFISIFFILGLGWSSYAFGFEKDFALPYRVSSSSGEECFLSVTVKDAHTGMPIERAKVLLGKVADTEHLTSTSSTGEARFPATVVCPKEDSIHTFPLTVAKEGYHSLTLHKNTQTVLEIYLQAKASDEEVPIAKGKMGPFPKGISRSRVEFGLFFPAYRTEHLLRLNRQQLISNQWESISVPFISSVSIPSNVVLPPQRKRYLGFSIPLNKPNFSFPLTPKAENFMCGAAASINISDLMGVARSKNYIDAIKAARITNVGCSSWTTVSGEKKFQIELGQKLVAKNLHSTYENAPRKLDTVFLSLFDPRKDTKEQGEALVIMDMKTAKKGKTTRSTRLSTQKSESTPTYVMAVGMDGKKFAESHNRSFQYTASIVKAVKNDRNFSAKLNGHLGIIRLDSISEDYRNIAFHLNKSSPAKLKPDLIFVQIVAEKVNKKKGVHRELIWVNILPPDARKLELPSINELPVLPSKESGYDFFIEITAVSLRGEKSKGLDTFLTIESLEHISHARERI